MRTVEERFWSKVDRSGGKDACWLWTAYRNPKGYGQFAWASKTIILAHRAAWRITYGDIPIQSCICHFCDNPSCVNPNHLWIGSHMDNVRDRDAKGRRRPPSGEYNGQCKLTHEHVIAI
ncbi:HNH endonuclease signature motif containing protein [Planctomicrobium sp. SH661]|uniref:HNH endonuclease signature motif containing protein n=1 Tax=Planctomicrobium sp. SH661 TaxID=3448124 RepID=UPI003F5B7072